MRPGLCVAGEQPVASLVEGQPEQVQVRSSGEAARSGGHGSSSEAAPGDGHVGVGGGQGGAGGGTARGRVMAGPRQGLCPPADPSRRATSAGRRR